MEIEEGQQRFVGGGQKEPPCCPGMTKQNCQIAIAALIVVTFFVGFGIGFAGGQNAPAVIDFVTVFAPPPPPWYVPVASPPVPSWAGVIGMTVTSLVLPAAFAPRGAWDRITWDASNSRLFVSTGEDGLVMVPVAGGVPLVANASLLPSSADCNGVVITPGAGGVELGFAGDVAEFTANTGDNGVGINVYSLGPTPVPFAANSVVDTGGVGVDNGVYDAFSSSAIMTLVNGSVLSLSASTGARKSVVNVYLPGCANNGAPCDPLEYPVVDGKGNLYINGAEANKVFHLSTKPLSLIGAYDVTPFNCIDPTGLDIDATRNRLFVGCANPGNPILLVLNAATGALIATLPIGRGNDGVRYDAARQRIYVSSGVAGNVVIIQQNVVGAIDSYAVREAVFTRPGARTLTFDPVTGTIYTMAPSGTYDPSQPVDPDAFGVAFFPNVWAPSSLAVISISLPAASG